MNNISQKFQDFMNYITTQWNDLPNIQKSIIGFLFVAVIDLLTFSFRKEKQDEYSIYIQKSRTERP